MPLYEVLEPNERLHEPIIRKADLMVMHFIDFLLHPITMWSPSGGALEGRYWTGGRYTPTVRIEMPNHEIIAESIGNFEGAVMGTSILLVSAREGYSVTDQFLLITDQKFIGHMLSDEGPHLTWLNLSLILSQWTKQW